MKRNNCFRYAAISGMSVMLTITTISMMRDRQQGPQQQQAHLTTNSDRRRPKNAFLAWYDVDISRRMDELTSRRAQANDPEVIRLARDVIDYPPENEDGIKHARYIMRTPQAAKVDELTNKMRGGFFVECGALDGERSSNTLYLEKQLGWTGLLVEMDPYFYTQLLGKNRQVWSINACLSPYDYVTTIAYRGDDSGAGRLILQSSGSSGKNMVPCFPLEALLIALNRTRVDYFSLDVEGVELPVLKTIPWDVFDIPILSVEYGHGPDGKTPYTEYMSGKGYAVHADIHESSFEKALFVEDFIFVKNLTRKSVASP